MPTSEPPGNRCETNPGDIRKTALKRNVDTLKRVPPHLLNSSTLSGFILYLRVWFPQGVKQQIDEFIAEEASWLPTGLLWDLLCPIGQLITSGAALQSLKEARAPDFMLPDQGGSAMKLLHLLEQGPVVMTFYRGAWCPYCHLALRAYQQALPQLQAGGVTLVAISPQSPNHSRALAEKLELTFAVYR